MLERRRKDWGIGEMRTVEAEELKSRDEGWKRGGGVVWKYVEKRVN